MAQPWLDLAALMSADPVKGAYLNERALDGTGAPLFRMALWRIWDAALPTIAVLMLNPSTADAREDDATIRRLIGLAKAEGYGGFIVVNRYAYRATYPTKLIEFGSVSAIGPNNLDWIRAAIADRDVLVAWGSNWIDERHLVDVEGLLLTHITQGRAYCLGYTTDGYPRHPLARDRAHPSPFEPYEAARRQRKS